MLRRLTGLFLLIAAIPPGLLFWQRRDLSYDELGRYFDAAEGVVYDVQAVTIYGALAAILLLAGLATLLSSHRSGK